MSFALDLADPNPSPEISAHSERRGNGTKADTKGRFWSNRISDASKNSIETDVLALKKQHMDFFSPLFSPLIIPNILTVV